MTLNNEQKRNLWIIGIIVVLIILGMNAQRLGFFALDYINIKSPAGTDTYEFGDKLNIKDSRFELMKSGQLIAINYFLDGNPIGSTPISNTNYVVYSATSGDSPDAVCTTFEAKSPNKIEDFVFAESDIGEHSLSFELIRHRTATNEQFPIKNCNNMAGTGATAEFLGGQTDIIVAKVNQCQGGNILQIPIQCPTESSTPQIIKEYQCINDEWKLTKDENCVAVGLPPPTTNGTIDSGVKIITLTGTKLVIERNGVIETIDIPQDEDRQRVIIQKEGNPIIQSFMIGKLSLNTILLLIGLIILITLGFRFRKIRLKR